MLCLRQVLSLLLPLRYSLVDIGGSWAQRQVVALTAIQAAIKGKQLNTALALIAELKVTDHHTLRTVGCAAAVDYCTGAVGIDAAATSHSVPQALKPKNRRLAKLFEQVRQETVDSK